MKKSLALVTLLVPLAFGAWAGEVSGRVRLPAGQSVPADSVVLVELRDVSVADARAMLVSKKEIRDATGKAEVPFAIGYDDARIKGGNSYAISARVTQKGKLLFINDTHTPVLGHGGKARDVEVAVSAVKK